MSSTKVTKHKGVTWTDIEGPTRKELENFAASYGLHALHIDECFSGGQLSQVEVEPNYIFLVLYFPHFVPTKNRIVTSQVGVFLGKDYLLTVHAEGVPGIRRIITASEAGDAERAHYMGTSPGYLLYRIVGGLLDELATLVHLVLGDLDALEDRVFDERSSEAHEIGQLRQKIMRLRRTSAVLKNMLGDLSIGITGFTSEDLARHYRTNTKTATKLWQTVEEATETIEIYKDADYTSNTEKTNKILAVLTLIFTLTIPATVLGTFYGMNVPIPGGLTTGPWTFLGIYTSFKLVIIASILSAFGMYWYFHRKDWL